MGWFDSVEHNRWLSRQLQEVLMQAKGAIVPTGFAHLTDQGVPDQSRPVDLAVTARMTYVFSLGTLLGIPGSRRFVDHGVKSLVNAFADAENGGWLTSIRPQLDQFGHGVAWDTNGGWKSQFHQAFLILGAAAATEANRPGAQELMDAALHDQERHWLRKDGLPQDWFSPDYSEASPVHSTEVLVHTVEAYLAAAEVTADPVWVERAQTIVGFVGKDAKARQWRITPYFDDNWAPVESMPNPVKDGRRIYSGIAVGHQFQWARLVLHLRAALHSMGRPMPDEYLEMAEELFERIRVDSWRKSAGLPGFVTVVSADGETVDDTHMAWTACEGVCTAVALRRALLDNGGTQADVEHYEHCYRSWLDYLNDNIVVKPGHWAHALDAQNHMIDAWASSRSDMYHSVQTLLTPRVPLWPPMASALARNLLDKSDQPPVDRHSWNLFHRRKG